MKIRTRLTLLFTFITATLLLAFAAVIYLSARADREREFYARLRREAITKANLFFNARVETRTLQDIYRTNRETLNEVEVAIYDSAFRLLYHDAVDIDFVKETPAMINDIHQKGELTFYQNRWQVVGLRHIYEGRPYAITAAAYDQYGYRKLDSLLQNSVLVFVGAMLFIYLAGRFYSKKAFDPVMEMTEKAKAISATQLHLRLKHNGNKDELAELANTFNDMLARLENSFEAQKQLVSHMAHELRTPLAAIIAELELSTGKPFSEEQYRQAMANVLDDARKLARLANSMLDLAKASYDPAGIVFKKLRVDELLLDARHVVQQANPEYKIDIRFDYVFESDREISVHGNEYLLRTAFVNLFENGCKFSAGRQCAVQAAWEDGKIRLRFSDQGVGIAPEDLPHVFTPFFRGGNNNRATGHGIGLSLTKKILQLHSAPITVASAVGSGTVFTVDFEPAAL
jgi:signal transduction histidine kinase